MDPTGRLTRAFAGAMIRAVRRSHSRVAMANPRLPGERWGHRRMTDLLKTGSNRSYRLVTKS